MNILMIKKGYNYTSKVAKALEEGNIKYIKMLIKKGKVIPTDFPDENYVDLTGELNGCPYNKNQPNDKKRSKMS